MQEPGQKDTMTIPLELCGSTQRDFEVYMSEADKDSLLDEEVQAIEDMDDDSCEILQDIDFDNQRYENYMIEQTERWY